MKETDDEWRHILQRKYRKKYLQRKEALERHRAKARAYYHAHREERLAYQRVIQKTEKWREANKISQRRRYLNNSHYRLKKIEVANAHYRRKRAQSILPPIINALLLWNERRET